MPTPPTEIELGASLWKDAWLRLRQNRMALGSGVVLLGLVLSALIGPLLSPYGFADGNLGLGATRPMERIIERAHLSVVDHPSNGQLGFSHFVSELGDKVSLDRLFPEISNQVRSELTAAGSPLVQLGLADLGFTFTDSETLGAQLSQSTLTEAELRLTDLGTAIYDLDSEERVVLRSALDEIRSIVRSAFASASKPLEEVLEGDPLSLEGMGVPLIYTLSGERHWFGTDELGRDLLVRVLVGGRVSLGVGVVAALVALIIGVLYGSISGYVGGQWTTL